MIQVVKEELLGVDCIPGHRWMGADLFLLASSLQDAL